MKTTIILTATLATMAAALPQREHAPPYGSTGAAPSDYYATEESFCDAPGLQCCLNVVKDTGNAFVFSQASDCKLP